MKHTLVVRVKDQRGVLSRVSGLFSRRAFSIDTLTVSGGETPGYARMTIVVDTLRTPAALVAASLRKLIPVVEVTDVTHMATVERDLALIRVRSAPGDRAEIAGLAEIFRGRVVDVAPESVIVEVTGDAGKIDGLLDLLRPRGIVEVVRTGKVAMLRGTASAASAGAADMELKKGA